MREKLVLKCMITVLLLASVLAGCGPSVREREAAWLQAFQWDLDSTHEKWRADLARNWFKTNAEAVRELKSRYEQVYARWFQRVDPLSQAILSYSVALASRSDRGEIGPDEANRLYYRLEADIAQARRALPQQPNESQRDAAMLQWWEGYWSQHRETYRATPGKPIDCRVISDEARGRLIQCD